MNIVSQKMASLKRLSCCSCDILKRKKNYGDHEKISGCRVPRKGEWDEQVERGFGRYQVFLWGTVMVVICHYTIVKTHRMQNRMNTNADLGL